VPVGFKGCIEIAFQADAGPPGRRRRIVPAGFAAVASCQLNQENRQEEKQ